MVHTRTMSPTAGGHPHHRRAHGPALPAEGRAEAREHIDTAPRAASVPPRCGLAKALGATVTAVCSTANVGWLRSLGGGPRDGATSAREFTQRADRCDVIFQHGGRGLHHLQTPALAPRAVRDQRGRWVGLLAHAEETSCSAVTGSLAGFSRADGGHRADRDLVRSRQTEGRDRPALPAVPPPSPGTATVDGATSAATWSSTWRRAVSLLTMRLRMRLGTQASRGSWPAGYWGTRCNRSGRCSIRSGSAARACGSVRGGMRPGARRNRSRCSPDGCSPGFGYLPRAPVRRRSSTPPGCCVSRHAGQVVVGGHLVDRLYSEATGWPPV